MKSKLYSLLAAVAMLGFAGAAHAQSPVQLTNSQMDHVTAGATAIGVGAGGAFGTMFSGTGIVINTAVLGSSAAAAGQVASAAGSWVPGPGAAAASSLSLVLTSP